MGAVRITSLYIQIHWKPFWLAPSSMHKMTGLGGTMVWTMTYSHRPHWFLVGSLSDCVPGWGWQDSLEWTPTRLSSTWNCLKNSTYWMVPSLLVSMRCISFWWYTKKSTERIITTWSSGCMLFGPFGVFRLLSHCYLGGGGGGLCHLHDAQLSCDFGVLSTLAGFASGYGQVAGGVWHWIHACGAT